MAIKFLQIRLKDSRKGSEEGSNKETRKEERMRNGNKQ